MESFDIKILILKNTYRVFTKIILKNLNFNLDGFFFFLLSLSHAFVFGVD